MKLFKADMRKLYSNRAIQVMLLFFLFLMIASPLWIRFIDGTRYGDFFETTGSHPFQFWLLMQSSNWGNRVYYAFFFLFPVLSTGLIFYHEKSSSVFDWIVTRSHYKTYVLSKAASVFLSTFLNFFILLSVNILVTWLCFSTDAPLTEQYYFYIPKETTFAYGLYQQGPLCMAMFYTFMNAFAIALLALFTLAVHMIVRIRNLYFAVLVPFILMYACNYANAALFSNRLQYNLRILL